MTLNGTGVYTLNRTGFYNRPWDDRGGDVSRISPTECTHLAAFLPPSSMHAQSRCCIISAGLCYQQWRCKCCRPLLANVPGSLRSLLASDNSTLHAACSLQHTDGLAVAHALPGVACTNMRFPLLGPTAGQTLSDHKTLPVDMLIAVGAELSVPTTPMPFCCSKTKR